MHAARIFGDLMHRRALIILTLVLPSVLAGQSPPTPDLPNGVMFQFIRFADSFGSRLVTAFDSIPAAKYNYRPTPSQQTIGYIAQHLENASYMRLLGLVPPSALPPRARVAIELPASALSSYVGVYELAVGLDFDVTLDNGALHIRSSNGGAAVQLWPESNNDFFAKDVDAQVTFVRDASGAVSGLVLHQYGRDRPAKKRG